MQFAKRKIWINGFRCICEMEIDGSMTFKDDVSIEELKWTIGVLLREAEFARQTRIGLDEKESRELSSIIDKINTKEAKNAALDEMVRINQETGQYDDVRPNPLIKSIRLKLKIKGGIDREEALKKITLMELNVPFKIIGHNDRTFLVEINESLVDTIHQSDLFCIVTSNTVIHKCVTVDLCGMTDEDVDKMSESDVKAKLKTIRDTALWWASQEDDDRCYLDDIEVLESILPHGSVNFEMPDDLTFIENCIRFKKTRCPKDLKIHEW